MSFGNPLISPEYGENCYNYTGVNKFKKWYPLGDLNPCYWTENPESWAGLDEGDTFIYFTYYTLKNKKIKRNPQYFFRDFNKNSI